jgi:YesN/AraC family two-component response regulator
MCFAAARRPSGATAPAEARMCTIAIVEDENLERLALRKILADHLADCMILGEAATGEEAMALIDKADIDLMLVDINIPRPNGLEVLHYLREKNAATKVIITTAHDTFDMAREAIHLKADEYLLKPVRPQLLIDAIRKCLDIHPTQSGRLHDHMNELCMFLSLDQYQNGVIRIREYVNDIYAQQDAVPARMIPDLADALAQLGKDNGLFSDILHASRLRLHSMRLDRHNRHKVMGELLSMIDALFQAAREKFGGTSDPMQKALNFIERNLYKGTTLEETAEQSHVSSCYLSRLFKKRLGINFVTYLTRRRMEMAKELLCGSDMTINAVCMELSYNDLNYFCKTFKKETGMSPAKYRKQAENAV